MTAENQHVRIAMPSAEHQPLLEPHQALPNEAPNARTVFAVTVEFVTQGFKAGEEIEKWVENWSAEAEQFRSKGRVGQPPLFDRINLLSGASYLHDLKKAKAQRENAHLSDAISWRFMEVWQADPKTGFPTELLEWRKSDERGKLLDSLCTTHGVDRAKIEEKSSVWIARKCRNGLGYVWTWKEPEGLLLAGDVQETRAPIWQQWLPVLIATLADVELNNRVFGEYWSVQTGSLPIGLAIGLLYGIFFNFYFLTPTAETMLQKVLPCVFDGKPATRCVDPCGILKFFEQGSSLSTVVDQNVRFKRNLGQKVDVLHDEVDKQLSRINQLSTGLEQLQNQFVAGADVPDASADVPDASADVPDASTTSQANYNSYSHEFVIKWRSSFEFEAAFLEGIYDATKRGAWPGFKDAKLFCYKDHQDWAMLGAGDMTIVYLAIFEFDAGKNLGQFLPTGLQIGQTKTWYEEERETKEKRVLRNIEKDGFDRFVNGGKKLGQKNKATGEMEARSSGDLLRFIHVDRDKWRDIFDKRSDKQVKNDLKPRAGYLTKLQLEAMLAPEIKSRSFDASLDQAFATFAGIERPDYISWNEFRTLWKVIETDPTLRDHWQGTRTMAMALDVQRAKNTWVSLLHDQGGPPPALWKIFVVVYLACFFTIWFGILYIIPLVIAIGITDPTAINAVTVTWNTFLITYFVAPLGMRIFRFWFLVASADDHAGQHCHWFQGMLSHGFERKWAPFVGSAIYIGGLLFAMFVYVGHMGDEDYFTEYSASGAIWF